MSQDWIIFHGTPDYLSWRTYVPVAQWLGNTGLKGKNCNYIHSKIICNKYALNPNVEYILTINISVVDVNHELM